MKPTDGDYQPTSNLIIKALCVLLTLTSIVGLFFSSLRVTSTTHTVTVTQK